MLAATVTCDEANAAPHLLQAILVAPEPQPETSLVDVVEQDEAGFSLTADAGARLGLQASSTHLAEVLDEPAADIVLAPWQHDLGNMLTALGFLAGEPAHRKDHTWA